MSPTVSGLVLGGAIVTLLLQTIALIGIIWRGGRWSQKVEDRQEKHEELLERIVDRLDHMDERLRDVEVGRK